MDVDSNLHQGGGAHDDGGYDVMGVYTLQMMARSSGGWITTAVSCSILQLEVVCHLAWTAASFFGVFFKF
jgi:hypothetical protein